MQELDEWTESAVVTPLLDNENEITLEDTIAGVKRVIREKVLQSYRNGQATGPRPVMRVKSEVRR